MTTSNETTEHAAPCPFCGGTNLRTEAYDIQPDNFHSAYVECDDCGACGTNALTLNGWLPSKGEAKIEAVVAWNRRASLPPPSAEPVAWMYETPMPDGSVFKGASVERLTIGLGVAPDSTESPLYAAASPPIQVAPSGWCVQQEFLKWNRSQKPPLVEISKEYFVVNKVLEIAAAAPVPQVAPEQASVRTDGQIEKYRLISKTALSARNAALKDAAALVVRLADAGGVGADHALRICADAIRALISKEAGQ